MGPENYPGLCHASYILSNVCPLGRSKLVIKMTLGLRKFKAKERGTLGTLVVKGLGV
jgi:hypothetical protein